MADHVHLSAEALQRVAADILEAAGSEPDEAAIVAGHLVRSNLAGHDSHGVGMLPSYVGFVEDGLLVPNTRVRLVEDGGSFLRLAGDRGYGQRVGREAMALGIERARRDGLCAIALVGSGHLGRIGDYGEQAVEAGLASIHFVNAVDHDPIVAPFGGRDARLGTNPVCIAFPGGERRPPTLLDMATSAVSFGKVRVAHNERRRMPAGTLLDADGLPTADPDVMFHDPAGALLPAGDHKGYGLALACELLAGVLTGGGTIQPANARSDSIVNHMLAFVLDPARFADPKWLAREVDALVDYALASPPRDADEPVLQPGDPERRRRASRLADDVPVDRATWDELLEAAARVGVAPGRLQESRRS